MLSFTQYYAQQQEHHKSICNTITNLKKLGVEKISQNAVKLRIEALEKTWKKFDVNNDMMIIERIGNEKSDYFKLEIFSQTEEKYFTTKKYLNDYLDHFDSLASAMMRKVKPVRIVRIRQPSVIGLFFRV